MERNQENETRAIHSLEEVRPAEAHHSNARLAQVGENLLLSSVRILLLCRRDVLAQAITGKFQLAHHIHHLVRI